ncbi:MAG: hypothetical protein ACKN9D_16635 [Actinomycetales bacterium]
MIDIRRSRAVTICLAVVALLATGAPARADTPNTIAAFVQPMSGCQIGRMGVMYCQGLLDAPIAIAPEPAVKTPLWSGTGYALCWRTAAGSTLPVGSSCTGDGTAIASGNNFGYSTTATFPMTFDGSAGSGCSPFPNNNQNSFFFTAGSLGDCVITISTTAAPGFSSTTSIFTLSVGLAPTPAFTGSITATSGRGRAGGSAPLQTITCKFDEQFDIWAPCPGVVLDWKVLTGTKTCRITVNQDTESQQYGSIGVTFRRAGRCTVQGSTPAVAGRWAAYVTPVFSYSIARVRN